MIYIYIVTLLLPSTISYSIQVKGTIELGDQLADVLSDFKDSFLRQMNSMPNNKAQKRVPLYSVPVAETNDGMPVPQDFPFMNDIPLMENVQGKNVRQVQNVEIPLLDEIVRKREGRVHIYGNHNKADLKQGGMPVNKIVV